MPTNLTAALQELLQKTSNLMALRERMTPNATYVSLNFDNPELKKVMPWTGTHKGPQELFDVFAAIQRYWKTLDFRVTDTIEQGSRVAFFGSMELCACSVSALLRDKRNSSWKLACQSPLAPRLRRSSTKTNRQPSSKK
jgi:uncharacterized protein